MLNTLYAFCFRLSAAALVILSVYWLAITPCILKLLRLIEEQCLVRYLQRYLPTLDYPIDDVIN
jgi:hypothetical protein